MVKTQDFSQELRPWFKLFEQTSRRYDYHRVFDDFLTMFLTQFCLPGQMDEEHKQAMSAYDVEEKKGMSAMFHELLTVFKNQVDTKGNKYYDLFGHCYEAVSGYGKRAHMGQYFTPETVVEMMVTMTMPEIMDGQGKRILDPACGSGRMLIIAHALHPGHYTYGQDVDAMCVKMTAINMMLHGCRGQVICGDALRPDDFRFGYKINSMLPAPYTGMPSILELKKEESLVIQHWEKVKEDHETKVSNTGQEVSKKGKEISKNEQKVSQPAPAPGQQLTIF